MESKTSIKGFLNKSTTITNKEKKLLIILLFVIFLWLINKLVLTTQAAEINNLEQKKTNYMTELLKIDDILKKEDVLNNQYYELNKVVNVLKSKYFSDIDQPYIMNLLNEILDETKLEILSMSFSEPSIEDLSDNIVAIYYTVSIPFQGSYDDLIFLLEKIRNNQPKLIIKDLSLSKENNDIVSGQLELDIYSVAEDDEDYTNYVYQTDSQDLIKNNPFIAFNGYEEVDGNDNSYNSEGNTPMNKDDNKTVLENFENNGVYFMPSAASVTGRVSQLSKAKYGRYSLRTEYFISTYDKEERAYIVLDDKDIIVKYPPSSIGLWIYSYGYSPVTLGLRFKDQEGEKIDLEMAKGVNWVGWRYVEVTPPQDINLYSLELDRIFIQLAASRDDYGVFLFDNLDMTYPISENQNNKMQEDVSYIFYVVQYGDTLESISENVYGTRSKVKEIMKDNGLDDVNAEVGQVLVIQK